MLTVVQAVCNCLLPFMAGLNHQRVSFWAASKDSCVYITSPYWSDRLGNVPFNSASLWTTYQIQKGNLQGVGGGFGLVYVGDRTNGIPNEFTVPSYVRTDAALFYRGDRYFYRKNHVRFSRQVRQLHH
ncbi:TonB-dependent receptor domain-containing protein [Nostoc sp. 'Lobaria pulmonaria (5183) cyanobiont']|uniref:TonB-dependent receptor domain-containing protein n=1 Tax=Nostoc sp. 'Lobaria pulmonaria (5183) cyanobiont' TaxID=1618022 RepID=UPI002D7A1DEE|nr:TonB-dependent receptor [Nostoc sp. 'Lobaria pulmonaria (5183) cyanobiont']